MKETLEKYHSKNIQRNFMRGVVVLVLVLIACEFVVGGAFSEIETSFVVMGVGDVDLDFWSMYGDYFIVGIIVLVVVAVYLGAIKGHGKKRRK